MVRLTRSRRRSGCLHGVVDRRRRPVEARPFSSRVLTFEGAPKREKGLFSFPHRDELPLSPKPVLYHLHYSLDFQISAKRGQWWKASCNIGRRARTSGVVSGINAYPLCSAAGKVSLKF